MKKFVRSIRKKILSASSKAASCVSDTRGELATNTIGGIIVAVVIIGLLIVAINAFFPNFLTNMFSKMTDKLNANW